MEELEELEHTCKTYLRVCGADEEFFEAFSKMTPCARRRGGIRAGYNEVYDVDVNCMIRETVKDLVGREEEFAALCRAHGVKAYLVIVPRLESKSSLPMPILSLDDDIIAFLYRAGIGMDLDYYVY